MTQNLHILKTLELPDRFESLKGLLGDCVAQLVVSPPDSTLSAFRKTAVSVKARGEGIFVPLSAPSGSGKTTLGNCLSVFLPEDFSPTITYTDVINYEALNRAVKDAREKLNANDRRIIPINMDHRESAPPSSIDL